MYDGFIEYMKTFLGIKVINQEIIQECKRKLSEMEKDIENDYE
jgi:hypothetical protein